MEEPVFRVLAHQVQNCGKGAGSFFPGMGHTPEPCHVNMGMTNPHDHRLHLLHGCPFLHLALEKPKCIRHSAIKFLRPGNQEVNLQISLVQHLQNADPAQVVFILHPDHPEEGIGQIRQFFAGFIQPDQLCQLKTTLCRNAQHPAPGF